MTQNNICTDPDKILERFMKEQFDFNALKKAGFFTKEMKADYKAQADRVCKFFGYKTVYEHGAQEIRCHLSYANPEGKPFITTLKSIYE